MNLSIKRILNSSRTFKECFPALIQKRNNYKIMSRPDPNRKLKSKIPVVEHSLAATINRRIELSGPMTVADYMKEVLTNPGEGYYMNKDVFGERGDFITSPEVSQLFGEIIGVWLLSEWMKLGSPKPLQLIELGPGRGTLLSDILRVTRDVGLEKDELSIHLVEISPTLQKMQADRLCMVHKAVEGEGCYHEGETISGRKIYWYKDIKDVPRQFSLILAHEFFDVLPIHKFKKSDDGWREILIDKDPSHKSTDPNTSKYRYVLSRNQTVPTNLYVPSALGESKLDQLEVSPQGLVIAQQLATRVEEDGGIALIADYGHNGNKGDTFRAFKRHSQTDPLCDVGSADLTADVDFSQLRKAASGALVLGPITQTAFLNAALAKLRLQILMENADSEEEKENFKSGYDMLTNPEKMGELFKFMAIFPTIDKEHYNKFPVMGFMEKNEKV